MLAKNGASFLNYVLQKFISKHEKKGRTGSSGLDWLG